MFTRRAVVLVMALTFAVGACSSGDTTEPSESSKTTGVYNLLTVNGSGLPTTVVQVDSDRLEVISGSLQLDTANTFSEKLSLRVTEAGQSQTRDVSEVGRWAITGNNTLTLLYASGTRIVANVSGSDISFQVAVDSIGPLNVLYRR